jgi:hypothetical protein
VVGAGERWWVLRVRFPVDVHSHSTKQEFYFGEDYLLRRHDYRVEVAGSFSAAHYLYDLADFDGLRYPTRRRVYMRGEDGMPITDKTVVSIDFDGYRFN